MAVDPTHVEAPLDLSQIDPAIDASPDEVDPLRQSHHHPLPPLRHSS
jgi:hypothetical protein